MSERHLQSRHHVRELLPVEPAQQALLKWHGRERGERCDDVERLVRRLAARPQRAAVEVAAELGAQHVHLVELLLRMEGSRAVAPVIPHLQALLESEASRAEGAQPRAGGSVLGGGGGDVSGAGRARGHPCGSDGSLIRAGATHALFGLSALGLASTAEDWSEVFLNHVQAGDVESEIDSIALGHYILQIHALARFFLCPTHF